MQSVLQISRKVEYALRAAIYLARLPDQQPVSFKEVAKAEDIPKDFLAKILRALVDAGIVNSARGQHGGFSLARPSEQVSFLDVIEAVEGPVLLNVCLDAQTPSCGRSAHCAMRDVWMLGQSKMLEVFRGTSLATLARAHTQPVLRPVDAPAASAL